MNPEGVRRPYLWVIVWVLFLVLIAALFWYFLLRPQPQTDEEIIQRSTAGASNSQLTQEQRSSITARSSAAATSTSFLTSEARAKIVTQSSVAPAAANKSGLTSPEKDALLRSSSARP